MAAPTGPGAAGHERRHTVEEVGGEGEPATRALGGHGVQCPRRAGVVGVGVAQRAQRADGRQGCGHAVTAGPFGRPGHVGERPRPGRLGQGRDQVEVGVDERGRVLGAAPHRGQERSLEVYAGQLATAHQLAEGLARRRAGSARVPTRVTRRPSSSRGRGGGRRHPAARGVGPELTAVATVAVDVDEPGSRVRPGRHPVGGADARPVGGSEPRSPAYAMLPSVTATTPSATTRSGSTTVPVSSRRWARVAGLAGSREDDGP